MTSEQEAELERYLDNVIQGCVTALDHEGCAQIEVGSSTNERHFVLGAVNGFDLLVTVKYVGDPGCCDEPCIDWPHCVEEDLTTPA